MLYSLFTLPGLIRQNKVIGYHDPARQSELLVDVSDRLNLTDDGQHIEGPCDKLARPFVQYTVTMGVWLLRCP